MDIDTARSQNCNKVQIKFCTQISHGFNNHEEKFNNRCVSLEALRSRDFKTLSQQSEIRYDFNHTSIFKSHEVIPNAENFSSQMNMVRVQTHASLDMLRKDPQLLSN